MVWGQSSTVRDSKPNGDNRGTVVTLETFRAVPVARHAINLCKTSFDIDPSQLPPVQNRFVKMFSCRCHSKLTKSQKQRSQIGEILFPIYPAQWFGRVHRLPVL